MAVFPIHYRQSDKTNLDVSSEETDLEINLPLPPTVASRPDWTLPWALSSSSTSGLSPTTAACLSHTDTSRPFQLLIFRMTVQIFLVFVGVYTGRDTDGGYFGPVSVSGIILHLLGTFMASLGPQYLQTFPSQVTFVGLGHDLTFGPAPSVLSSYFLKKRALAVGLALAGRATGCRQPAMSGSAGKYEFSCFQKTWRPKKGPNWPYRAMGSGPSGHKGSPLTWRRRRGSGSPMNL